MYSMSSLPPHNPKKRRRSVTNVLASTIHADSTKTDIADNHSEQEHKLSSLDTQCLTAICSRLSGYEISSLFQVGCKWINAKLATTVYELRYKVRYTATACRALIHCTWPTLLSHFTRLRKLHIIHSLSDGTSFVCAGVNLSCLPSSLTDLHFKKVTFHTTNKEHLNPGRLLPNLMRIKLNQVVAKITSRRSGFVQSSETYFFLVKLLNSAENLMYLSFKPRPSPDGLTTADWYAQECIVAAAVRPTVETLRCSAHLFSLIAQAKRTLPCLDKLVLYVRTFRDQHSLDTLVEESSFPTNISSFKITDWDHVAVVTNISKLIQSLPTERLTRLKLFLWSIRINQSLINEFERFQRLERLAIYQDDELPLNSLDLSPLPRSLTDIPYSIICAASLEEKVPLSLRATSLLKYSPVFILQDDDNPLKSMQMPGHNNKSTPDEVHPSAATASCKEPCLECYLRAHLTKAFVIDYGGGFLPLYNMHNLTRFYYSDTEVDMLTLERAVFIWKALPVSLTALTFSLACPDAFNLWECEGEDNAMSQDDILDDSRPQQFVAALKRLNRLRIFTLGTVCLHTRSTQKYSLIHKRYMNLLQHLPRQLSELRLSNHSIVTNPLDNTSVVKYVRPLHFKEGALPPGLSKLGVDIGSLSLSASFMYSLPRNLCKLGISAFKIGITSGFFHAKHWFPHLPPSLRHVELSLADDDRFRVEEVDENAFCLGLPGGRFFLKRHCYPPTLIDEDGNWFI